MKKIIFLLTALMIANVLLFQQTTVISKTTAAEPVPTAAPRSEKISAEGRIITYEGAEITVSADFTGLLANISVKEGDKVKQGQLLASIHAEDTQAALAQAQTRAMENAAEIKLAHYEFNRMDNLMRQNSISRQEFDRAERNLTASKAHYATDLTEIDRLQAVLNKANITAPIAGTVITRHIDTGEAVKSGSSIVTLADLTQLRIEAEVDEFDVGKVQLNAPVQITAEGFAQTWLGHIEDIPANVTTRRLKPPDPARPVDTRVLMVKIALHDKNIPLKLGQRVSVNIG